MAFDIACTLDNKYLIIGGKGDKICIFNLQ